VKVKGEIEKKHEFMHQQMELKDWGEKLSFESYITRRAVNEAAKYYVKGKLGE